MIGIIVILDSFGNYAQHGNIQKLPESVSLKNFPRNVGFQK